MLKSVTALILWTMLANIAFANRVDEHYQRGIKSLEKGRYQEAIGVFDEVLRSAKADANKNWIADVHFQKASAYYALAEFETAISEYRNAIALNPNSAVYYNALGISHAELKQYKAAHDAYEKALKLSPHVFETPAEPHYNIGLLHLKQGSLPPAVEAFKRAITLNPKWDDAHNGLAEAYLKQRLLKKAEQAWTKSLQLNPNGIAALLGLGQVHAKQKLYDKAETKFKKIIELHSDNTQAHYQLAQIYISRRQKEKAAEAMAYFKILRDTDPLLQKAQQYIKVHPDNPKGYNNLGIVYLTRQRYDKAIKNYKRAITLSPTLASPHYNLGLAYHKQNKIELAINAYQKAISIDASLAIAHNNIAVCYAELKVNLKKALTHAQTATDLAPTEANYWDTLATVYTHLGLDSPALQARKKHDVLLRKVK